MSSNQREERRVLMDLSFYRTPVKYFILPMKTIKVAFNKPVEFNFGTSKL